MESLMKKNLPEGWVKLTDWETGKPIYVNRAQLKSVRELPAEVCDDFDDEPLQELGERTRVDTTSDMFLVREKAAEVLGIE
jgi:hypothetical protein